VKDRRGPPWIFEKIPENSVKVLKTLRSSPLRGEKKKFIAKFYRVFRIVMIFRNHPFMVWQGACGAPLLKIH